MEIYWYSVIVPSAFQYCSAASPARTVVHIYFKYNVTRMSALTPCPLHFPEHSCTSKTLTFWHCRFRHTFRKEKKTWTILENWWWWTQQDAYIITGWQMDELLLCMWLTLVKFNSWWLNLSNHSKKITPTRKWEHNLWLCCFRVCVKRQQVHGWFHHRWRSLLFSCGVNLKALLVWKIEKSFEKNKGLLSGYQYLHIM